MATTADDLNPILRSRLKVALYKLADKPGIGDWRDHIADDIGVDRSTVENWFYGNNLPSLAGWVALCLRVPGLENLVLAEITQTKIDLDPIAMIEAALKELKNNARGKVVSIDGKIS